MLPIKKTQSSTELSRCPACSRLHDHESWALSDIGETELKALALVRSIGHVIRTFLSFALLLLLLPLEPLLNLLPRVLQCLHDVAVLARRDGNLFHRLLFTVSAGLDDMDADQGVRNGHVLDAVD